MRSAVNKLTIKVIARTGVIWEGEGTSCSMVNELGPFDILEQHTQFVTTIHDKISIRQGDKIIWDFTLDTGALCRVKANLVEIWLGI